MYTPLTELILLYLNSMTFSRLTNVTLVIIANYDYRLNLTISEENFMRVNIEFLTLVSRRNSKITVSSGVGTGPGTCPEKFSVPGTECNLYLF